MKSAVTVNFSEDEIIAEVVDGPKMVFELVKIDGVIEKPLPLTTGCFGFDWCVRIDDPNRAVFNKPNGEDDITSSDVLIYGESDSEDPPTGVLYTNNVNKVCFGSSSPNHNQLRGFITAWGHGAPAAIQARCASPVFAAQCYQEEK